MFLSTVSRALTPASSSSSSSSSSPSPSTLFVACRASSAAAATASSPSSPSAVAAARLGVSRSFAARRSWPPPYSSRAQTMLPHTAAQVYGPIRLAGHDLRALDAGTFHRQQLDAMRAAVDAKHARDATRAAPVRARRVVAKEQRLARHVERTQRNRAEEESRESSRVAAIHARRARAADARREYLRALVDDADRWALHPSEMRNDRYDLLSFEIKPYDGHN